MLITKTNPVGADKLIQRFQTALHSKLISEWGVSDSLYRCYGRAYRNQTTNGYVAENYEGANEYKEVYWDNSLAAISFFGMATRSDIETGISSDMHLVFFVDLAKLKPSIAHRADLEVQKDVLNAIGSALYGAKPTGIETGIENVLREYSGSRRDERLKFIDMHPTNCFRINLSVNYNINIC